MGLVAIVQGEPLQDVELGPGLRVDLTRRDATQPDATDQRTARHVVPNDELWRAYATLPSLCHFPCGTYHTSTYAITSYNSDCLYRDALHFAILALVM